MKYYQNMKLYSRNKFVKHLKDEWAEQKFSSKIKFNGLIKWLL